MLHFDCCLCGQEYARNIITRLDPDKSLIKYTFCRDQCRRVWRMDQDKCVLVKDLSCVGCNLSSLVLVDNCPQVSLFVADYNGEHIPIQTIIIY
jgi:NLI interacting factor-like phosphatase